MESCGLSQQRASDTAELLNQDGIDSLTSLQSCIQGTPDALTETRLPKIQQILIKSKVLALNKVKLCDLSVSDVELLINNVCGKQYGSTFQLKEINGFVLTSVQSVEKLAEWGELSIIHANTLWYYLQQWKEQGVPHDLLQNTYGRLKLEKNKSSLESSAARIKQEPTRTLSTSSAVSSQQQPTQASHNGTHSNQSATSPPAGGITSFSPTQLQKLASIAPPASLSPPSGSAVPVPRKRSALAAGLDNDNVVAHTDAGTVSIPAAVKQATMALNFGHKVCKVLNPASERDSEQPAAVQILNTVLVITAEPSKVAAVPPLPPTKSPIREVVKATATRQSTGKSRPDSRQSNNEYKHAGSGNSSNLGSSGSSSSDSDGDSIDDSSSDFDSSSDDSEATPPQKHPRATRKLSPQFARISQRSTKGTAPAREALHSPVVRLLKNPTVKLSRELLSLYKETNPPPRSASANSATSADSSKKGSAKKATPQSGKFRPIGGGTASPVDSAVMAAMKRHLPMLSSNDAEKQLEALKYYSLYAAKRKALCYCSCALSDHKF